MWRLRRCNNAHAKAPGRKEEPLAFLGGFAPLRGLFSSQLVPLLLLHLRNVGKPEVAAQVGQGFQIDIAHQIADGKLLGFAGQDGDAGDLTSFVAPPYFDVFAPPAALDADDAAPLRRLELIAHPVEIGRSVAALLLELEALNVDTLDADRKSTRLNS